MVRGPLELAFAYSEASQQEAASSAEIAGRLEQARTAALLSLAESLAALAAAAVDDAVEEPHRRRQAR